MHVNIHRRFAANFRPFDERILDGPPAIVKVTIALAFTLDTLYRADDSASGKVFAKAFVRKLECSVDPLDSFILSKVECH